jgi:hypothetical protein
MRLYSVRVTDEGRELTIKCSGIPAMIKEDLRGRAARIRKRNWVCEYAAKWISLETVRAPLSNPSYGFVFRIAVKS